VQDLALRADRAANGKGAELLGFARAASSVAGLQDGDVLIVADDELKGVSANDIARASAVIVIGTVLPDAARAATVVLPITNYTEEEGTFTNVRGHVQRFLQARTAPGLTRASWSVLSDLLIALGQSANYYLPSDVFAALAATSPTFTGMTYDTLGLRGIPVHGQTAGAA